MKDFNFYIDRQFGCAIFIKVENGIVKDIINESEKYINKMKELYLGKEISYLKEHFEASKKGASFHCVHSLELSNAKGSFRNFELRALSFYSTLFEKYKIAIPFNPSIETCANPSLASDISKPANIFSEEDTNKLKEIQEEYYQAKINLEATKKMLKEVHKFDFNVKESPRI